jgi:hypothetical protein
MGWFDTMGMMGSSMSTAMQATAMANSSNAAQEELAKANMKMSLTTARTTLEKTAAANLATAARPGG